MKILWVKAGKLLPVDTGGKIRSYNILRALMRTHEVTLLTYYGGARDKAYEAAAANEFPGAATIHTDAPDASVLHQSFDYARRFLNPAPYAISKFTHASVRRAVTAWLDEKHFDVAICDFLAASLNFPDRLRTPTVLFQHNVESILWRRRAVTESNPVKKLAYSIESAKMTACERSALRRFHHVIAVSEIDRQEMLAMDRSASISVVPTGVDTAKFAIAPPSTTNPPRIVFTGSMDWEPNIDAMEYFCSQIWPGIRAQFPTAVFQIVGRNPHNRVLRLASESVQVTGTVPSVVDYLHAATVVVVPLRIGGGTRLKIFEAMAMGKALVSTSIGAEGLDVQTGRDLILADDPNAFADAILQLLRADATRRDFEQAAVRLASQYDWSRIVEKFVEALLTTIRSVQEASASQPTLVR